MGAWRQSASGQKTSDACAEIRRWRCWSERNAGAPVVQKGHLPDSLSSLMRLAFDASKLRHTSRSAEKSMQPRLRAFSSAVRTKRIAASPDKTGMLLIARAISELPFAAYYSKNWRNVLGGNHTTVWDCAVLCGISYLRALGPLRPLRGSRVALGQPDAFDAHARHRRRPSPHGIW